MKKSANWRDKNQFVEIKLKILKKLFNSYNNLDKHIIDKNYKELLNNQKNTPITNSREIKKTDRVILNLSSENKTVPDFLSPKNLPIIINSNYKFFRFRSNY